MNITGTVDSILHHKKAQVWSIAPEATVFEAIQLMADKNIGALPVLKDGKVLGLVTERDYTRKVALKGKASKQTAVNEILSTPMISAGPKIRCSRGPRLLKVARIRSRFEV